MLPAARFAESESLQYIMVQARSMAASERRAEEARPAADSLQQPAGSAGTAAAGTGRAAHAADSGPPGASSHQSAPAGGAQPAAVAAGAGAAAGRPPRMQRSAQLFRELRERHGAPSPAWLVVAPLVQVRMPLTCITIYPL